MRLLLIRHGQTSSNVGHHLDTAEPGADLTDFGWRQAQAIPAALAAEPIDAIYTSTLTRTQQTAQPLARERGLVPSVLPGLREISAGDLEMRNDMEAIEAYVETVFGWDRDLDRRVPGAQSGREVLVRFDEAVGHMAASGARTAVAFSHGAVIRVWAGLRTANTDLAYAASHWLANSAMVVVSGTPGDGWRVERWSEYALGGPELSDPAHTGPAGEPEDEALEHA